MSIIYLLDSKLVPVKEVLGFPAIKPTMANVK
jgi:hypothetical protein